VATSPASAPPQIPVAQPARRGRKRRPGLAAFFAFLALCGLAAAGFGVYIQRQPRTFTPAQRASIEAWEVAKRWRTTPKKVLFPMVVRYQLAGAAQLGSAGALRLTARRLGIAPQASCAGVAGADPKVVSVLRSGGCQAMLRATYTDASGSLVLTVGIAVMRSPAAALSATHFITTATPGAQGDMSRRLVLRPLAVPGTSASAFALLQRQLSWAADAGPYVIMATVGYADGRGHVPVTKDPYTSLEMTSLARGVVVAVATPLGAPAPAPHCPGGPACLQ
jgi:hypothetical protein